MRIYTVIFMVACLIVWGAYRMGVRIATQQCRADNAAAVLNMQTQTIKHQEKLNAETFNTAAADIRRRLREKYTIAD